MLSAVSPTLLPSLAAVGDTAAGVVFTAWWCCSVGTTWTVELRSAQRCVRGRPLEWICSGIPTQQPAPEQLSTHLLQERGFLLFPDDPPQPRTRSRRLIGYVTRDPEVMRLARRLPDNRDAGSEHPMLIAARRIHPGVPPGAGALLTSLSEARLEQLVQPGYL